MLAVVEFFEYDFLVIYKVATKRAGAEKARKPIYETAPGS